MPCQTRPVRRSSGSQRGSAKACAVLLASLAVMGSIVQTTDAARLVPTSTRKLNQASPLPEAVPVFPPVLPQVSVNSAAWEMQIDSSGMKQAKATRLFGVLLC
jgi:hypothetical protein